MAENIKTSFADNAALLPDVQILYHSFVRIGDWHFYDNSMPFWRLYYNYDEGAYVKVGSRTVNMTPDKVILLSPDVVISTDAKKEYHIRHFFVHFDISGIIQNHPNGVFEIDVSDMQGLINMICNEKTDFAGLRNTLRVRSLITFLLSHLSDEILQKWSGKTYAAERIRKVVKYIQKNYNRSISNNQLAAVAGVSMNQLLRDFRNNIGLSPQAYIRREQIRNACIMLNSSLLSIDEIAEQTGFFDRYHFSKIFRNVTGVPPAGYRRKITSGKFNLSSDK